MPLIIPHSVDSTVIDHFWLKALTLIAVTVVIFVFIGNVNKHRKGLSKSGGLDGTELLSDELVFDRSISISRIVIYYSIIVLLAIPLFLIVHIGVAVSLVLFLLIGTSGVIFFDSFIQHSKIVINRVERTVTLSSTVGTRTIKSEKVKAFKELVFEKYHDDGFKKYALFIDEVDSSWGVWNDFSGDEAALIQDWVKEGSQEK